MELSWQACWPLDLAHKAAWAKVNCTSSDNNASESVNDMVSEACAKCLALVDARNRNGDPGQARLILIDGLVQWAQAHAKFHQIKCPHSLVRSFVKVLYSRLTSIGFCNHSRLECEWRTMK